MKTSSIDEYVTFAQNTAVTIESLSELLHDQIDTVCEYSHMPHSGYKERMLALTDSIRLLAKHINLEGVEI